MCHSLQSNFILFQCSCELFRSIHGNYYSQGIPLVTPVLINYFHSFKRLTQSPYTMATILSLAAISAHLCLAEAFPIQCHFLQWPWRSKHNDISQNTRCKVVEFSEMSLSFVKRCCALWNVFSVMLCFWEMLCFLKWFLDLWGHSTRRLRY